jgi:rhamnopyranosyl-N-acetylglucosaminyl-diphospho-decaprenol beta-1,3/1,4-galactofuranosyltransferase
MTSEQRSPHPSVAAVVVTFNRLALLERCLHALRTQHRPPEITIIIDNASTDGTSEYIARISDPRCHAISLSANTGGAGGFHIGTELALALGADWVWMMDDDGWPAADCLERLVEAALARQLGIANALVLDENGEELSFFLRRPESKRLYPLGVVEARSLGVIEGQINPFNGTLVKRSVFEHIGNVDYLYFLWGDEIDFLRRATHARIPMATISAAEFRHPRRPAGLDLCGLGHLQWVDGRNKGVFVRNRARLSRKAGGIARSVVVTLAYGAYWTWRGGPSAGATAIRYGIDGLGRGRLYPSADYLAGLMSSSLAAAFQCVQRQISNPEPT